MKRRLRWTGAMLLVCMAVTLRAQTPVRQWERFFNGNLTGKDEARSVIADDNGNVLVTGTSYHFFAGGNFSTIKYDSSGNQLWADHYYSAQQGFFNGGKKLVRDKWGNFYAVGTLAINDGDLAIIKYGPNGRLWTYNYQPYWFSTYDDFGVDMGVDSSGNFYAIAQVTSPSGNMDDLYIMKCDSSGTKIWDDNYSGASGADYPRSLAVAASGNTYSILSTFNFFGTATYDLATKKYTPAGNPDWTSNYNGQGNAGDFPSMIDIDAQENTYVCGAADMGASADLVYYRQNAFGTRLWTVTYNGTAGLNDTAISIRRLPNNLVAATGNSFELLNGTPRKCVVTMLIDSGAVLWTRKYYGTDSLGAAAAQMITDVNGNIVICGYQDTPGMFRNGMMLVYDSAGNVLWSDNYDGGAGLNDMFNALTIDGFGNYFATGQSYSTGTTNANYVTVKYGYGTPSGTHELHSVQPGLSPNPASRGESVRITGTTKLDAAGIRVLNTSGHRITAAVSGANGSVLMDTHSMIPGMYIIIPGKDTGLKPVKLIIQ